MKIVFFILTTIFSITFLLYFLVHDQEPDSLDRVFIEIAPAQKGRPSSRPTKSETGHEGHDHSKNPHTDIQNPHGDDTKNPFGLTPARQIEIRNWILPVQDQETQEALLKAFMALFHEDRSKRNGKFAKDNIDQVLQKDPQNAIAYRLLGYFHINNGFRTQEAITAYQKAIELQPNYGEAHYALAFSLVTSDLSVAKKHFVRAMELGVEDERDLANQYFKEVDMTAFRKPEKPKNPPEKTDNAVLLQSMPPSRQKEYQTYLQTLPDSEIRTILIEVFMNLFHPDKAQRKGSLAKEQLEKVLQKDPQNAVAHRLMGYYHIDQGGFDMVKSTESYLKALEYSPDYGDVHYALAFSFAMSDLPRGEKHFIRATELGIADERKLGEKFYQKSK